MSIGKLEIVRYESSTGPWQAIRTDCPTWSAVESAVRRMDGDLFPILELFSDRNPPQDAVPDFELLGGTKGYFVTARQSGQAFYHRDDVAAAEEVVVWFSDQGFSCPNFMVCMDVEKVVAATRHFFETGQLFKNFSWSQKFR